MGTRIRDHPFCTLKSLALIAGQDMEGNSLSQMGLVSSHYQLSARRNMLSTSVGLTFTLRDLHVKQPLRVLRCLILELSILAVGRGILWLKIEDSASYIDSLLLGLYQNATPSK